MSKKKATISFIDNIDSPRIYYTDKVADQINYIVNKCKGEVGWLGLMEQLEGHNAYLVTDMYIPPQRAHGTETDILPQDMVELHFQIEEEGKDPNLLRYWGHSHVNMGVSPSGQDVKQVMEYRTEGVDHFVMAIYNKKGESNVEFFDFAGGLRHQGCWDGRVRVGLTDEETKELDGILQTNVKTYYTTYNNYNRNHNNQPHKNGNVHGKRRNNNASNQQSLPNIPVVTQKGKQKKSQGAGQSHGGGISKQQPQASGKNENEGQEITVNVYGRDNKPSATKELMWNEKAGFYEAEAGA